MTLPNKPTFRQFAEMLASGVSFRIDISSHQQVELTIGDEETIYMSSSEARCLAALLTLAAGNSDEMHRDASV